MTSYDTKGYDVVTQISQQEFSEQLAARFTQDGLAGGLGGDFDGEIESTIDFQFDTPYAKFNENETITVTIPFDNSYLEVALVTNGGLSDLQGTIDITQGITVQRDGNARHVVFDLGAEPTIDLSFAPHSQRDLENTGDVPVNENDEPVGLFEAADTMPFEDFLRREIREQTRAALDEVGEVHLLGRGREGEVPLAVDQSADAAPTALFEIDAGIVTTDDPDTHDALVVAGWLDSDAMPDGDRDSPGQILSRTVVDYDRPAAVILDAPRIVEEVVCPNLSESILGDPNPFQGGDHDIEPPCTLQEPTRTTLDGREVRVESMKARSTEDFFTLSAHVTKETTVYDASVDISAAAAVTIEDGEPSLDVSMDDPETDIRVKPGAYIAAVVIATVTGGLVTSILPAFNGAFVTGYYSLWGPPLASDIAEAEVNNRVEEQFRERSNAMQMGEALGPQAGGMTYVGEPDHSPESLILYGVPDTDQEADIIADSRTPLGHEWVPLKPGQALDLDRNRRRRTSPGSIPEGFDLYWERAGGDGQDLRCLDGARANATERVRTKPFDAVTLADLQRVNYAADDTDTTRIDGASIPMLEDPEPAADLLVPGHETIDPAGIGYRTGVRTTERQYAICGILRDESQLYIQYRTYASPVPSVDIVGDSEVEFVSERSTESQRWASVDCRDGITINGDTVGEDLRINQYDGDVTIAGFTYNPMTLEADTSYLALPADYTWAIDGRRIDDIGERTIGGVTVEWTAFGRECHLEADEDELRDVLSRDDGLEFSVSVEVTDTFGVAERTTETVSLADVKPQGGGGPVDPGGCLDIDRSPPPDRRYPDDIPTEPVPPIGVGDGPGPVVDLDGVTPRIFAERLLAATEGNQLGDHTAELVGRDTAAVEGREQSPQLANDVAATGLTRREVLLNAVEAGMDIRVE